MTNKLKLTAVIGGACLALGLSAQSAHATSYSCSYASVSGYSSVTSTYSGCAANSTNNQASTVATANAVLSTAATASAKLISNRVSAAVGGQSSFNVAANGFSASTGVAAGNYAGKIGAWISGAWSNLDDSNTDTAFKGDVFSTMVGADYKLTSKTVVGLALGYENIGLDTAYNGYAGNKGKLDGDGYTIAPYVGSELVPGVSGNVSVGYTRVNYDTTRYDPASGNKLTGSTDADRYFIDASVSGSHTVAPNWTLYGKTSLFYAHEDKDAFTETETNTAGSSTVGTVANSSVNNDFGQAALEARIAYKYQMVEPYALLGVSYDFAKDESPIAVGQSKSSLDDQDFAAKWGGGLNLKVSPNVVGNIEAYSVEFRDNYNEYGVTGGLRVKF